VPSRRQRLNDKHCAESELHKAIRVFIETHANRPTVSQDAQLNHSEPAWLSIQVDRHGFQLGVVVQAIFAQFSALT